MGQTLSSPSPSALVQFFLPYRTDTHALSNLEFYSSKILATYPDIIRNIIALIIALIASRIVRNFISDTYVCSSFAFVITTLL